MGEREIDNRFKAMNGYPGLRRFKKGITSVTQWTGTEHKEMEKILLGITIGGIPNRMIPVVRSLLDFIYLSQLQYHTSTTISSLENCLKTFHDNKNVIIELGIRDHFNIPKLHSLLHYVDCIRSLGSADGYNSESPERLHIDFAKDAYRASNKRDYVEQMALWLQRHEAMWLRESFLMWVEKRLESLIERSDVNTLDDPAYYEEDEVEPMIDVTQRDINITHSQDNGGPRDNLNLTYSLAKSPPHHNLTVDKLAEKFGTTNFLPALTIFLRHNLPGTTVTPTFHDRFDAYKQIVISLPCNRYLGDRNIMDRVRTSPSVPASGRALARPRHFDTALIIEDLDLYKSEGGLSGFDFLFYINDYLVKSNFFPSIGLRIAQIRLIFDLPPQFGSFRHPLAYVEWFTRLGSFDPNTQLYSVTRSTRQGQRNAEIVSVDRIVRGCHLMARCGQIIPSTWTTDNVLEQNSIQYFVNPYINVDSFTLLKASLFSE
jgi:hypothetical protein